MINSPKPVGTKTCPHEHFTLSLSQYREFLARLMVLARLPAVTMLLRLPLCHAKRQKNKPGA